MPVPVPVPVPDSCVISGTGTGTGTGTGLRPGHGQICPDLLRSYFTGGQYVEIVGNLRSAPCGERLFLPAVDGADRRAGRRIWFTSLAFGSLRAFTDAVNACEA